MLGEGELANTQGLQELVEQDLAGMSWCPPTRDSLPEDPQEGP